MGLADLLAVLFIVFGVVLMIMDQIAFDVSFSIDARIVSKVMHGFYAPMRHLPPEQTKIIEQLDAVEEKKELEHERK